MHEGYRRVWKLGVEKSLDTEVETDGPFCWDLEGHGAEGKEDVPFNYVSRV